LELPHGPWFYWECSLLDAFPRPMARLRTTGRKRYPGLVLVLEHCRKRAHVCLLYFPTRSGWDSRVSPKLTDLHPQLNADSEAQVRFHCRGAFAAPARDGIGAAAADLETVQLVSEWQVACRIHAIPQPANSPLSNPSPCGCVRDRWDDRKR